MSSAHRRRQLRYRVSLYPNSSFHSLLRAVTPSLVLVSPCLRQYVNRYSGCNSTDTTPAGYWYLRIHRNPRRVSTFNSWKKDIAFEGECLLPCHHLTSFPPRNFFDPTYNSYLYYASGLSVHTRCQLSKSVMLPTAIALKLDLSMT